MRNYFTSLKDKIFEKRNPAHKSQDTTVTYTEFSDGEETFTQKLKAEHQTKCEELSKQGKILGLSNLPSSDSKTPHGVEIEAQSFYQGLIHRLAKIATESITDLKVTVTKLRTEVGEFEKQMADKIRAASEKISAAREVATKKVNTIYAQKRTSCTEKLSELTALIKTEKLTISELKLALEPDHEDSVSLLCKKIQYSLLLIIALLELAMSNKTVVVMLEDLISTFLLAILFSLIIPISAHFFGSFLKKKHNTRKEVFIMVAAFLGAVVFSGIVGYIRFRYLEERHVFVLSSWGFAAINFILFLIASFISYHFSFKNPEMVKALFAHKKALAKAEVEYAEFQEQQNNLESEEAKEHQTIADRYQDNAKARAEAQLAKMKAELLAKEKEYTSVFAAMKNHEQLICSNFDEAISMFRSTNEMWRSTPIPLYFSNLKSILETFFVEKEREPIFSANGAKSKVTV